MFSDDYEGGCLGIILIGVFFVGIIVYIVILLATIIGMIAGIAGTVYGGGYAIKNYISSFKENVIDSNRTAA